MNMKTMRDPLPGRKVFILEWRPSISSYKMEDFTDELEHFDTAWFNWSIWDWQEAVPGDEFFMIKCGEEPSGIVMHGLFTSRPYQGEDWSGKGREVYYADLEPDTMIHPERCRLLSTETLEAAMPGFQWNGGHSGRVLPSGYESKLHELWNEYLEMNNDFFSEKKAAKRVLYHI